MSQAQLEKNNETSFKTFWLSDFDEKQDYASAVPLHIHQT